MRPIIRTLGYAETNGDLLGFLRGLLDTETLPITISAAALLASACAVLVSYKNMKATEKNAAAAEKGVVQAASQAQAAMQQASSAERQGLAAYENMEISALVAARNRIDAASPRLSVTIFRKNEFAVLAERYYDLAVPFTQGCAGKPTKLDLVTQGHWDAFFVSYGLLHNFGVEPAQVITAEVQFYEGTHPFTGEMIREPFTSIQGARLLYPGQFALFQIVAVKQVDSWVRLLRKGKSPNDVECKSRMEFFPADLDDPKCSADITTTGVPLFLQKRATEVRAVFRPDSYFGVNVEMRRESLDSLEEIAIRLKGDEVELRSFLTKKHLREVMIARATRGEVAEDLE